MSSGSSKELAENKIILLYIIEKIGMPVSNIQITKLVLEKKLMNYFLLQQLLNELCESGFLEHVDTDGKLFYKISPSGKKTLEYFTSLIPFGIRSIIDNTIPEIRKEIRNDTFITADFVPKSEKEFVVSCKMDEEDFTLIELHVTVGTKSDARNICENWKKHSQEIYSEIVNSLTRKRESPDR